MDLVRSIAVLVLAAVLAVAPARALAADAVPEFPDDRVAVAPGVSIDFAPLERFLAGFEPGSGATFHVCVVRFSNAQNRAVRDGASTIDYAEAVFERWRPHLDAENHVLVVLATENRGIAIQPGSRWAGLGFEQRAITRVIDGSRFAPTARAGNFPLALERLVEAVDLHLSLRLDEQRRSAAQLAQRITSLRDAVDAESAGLASEPFDVTSLREQLAEASAALDRAERFVEGGDALNASRSRDTAATALTLVRRQRLAQQNEAKRIEALRAGAPAAVEQAHAAWQRLDSDLRAAPFDTTEQQADLAEAHKDLDRADAALEAGDALEAARRAASVGAWIRGIGTSLQQARQTHQTHLANRARAEERESEVERLLIERETDLTRAPFADADLSTALAGARSTWEQAQARRAADDAGAAVELFDEAESRLARYDVAFVETERDHRVRTVVIPAVVGSAGLVIFLVVLLSLQLRRRSKRDRAARRIASWQRLLERAGTRLVKLRDDHPHLFGSRRRSHGYTGETAATFEDVGAQIDDLFLTYGAADAQLDRARALLDSAGPFGWAAFDRAHACLETDQVELRRENVGDEQLFLPETRVISRRADELLEHMADVYESVYEAAKGLEARLVAAQAVRDDALAAIGAAEDGLPPIEQRGVRTRRFEEALGALASRHEELADDLRSDPVGALAACTALQEDAHALGARVERAARAVIVASEALDVTLPDTERRLTTLRAEGLRMEEPGFEPGAMLRRARQAARDARRAAEDALDEPAEEAAITAQTTLAELGDLVDRTLASRDGTAQSVAALRALLVELRERLPERTRRLAALRGEHADDALRPALDNIEEADAALAFADACFDDATAAVAVAEQRYLAGAELAERGRATLDRIRALYDEIEEKAMELHVARDDAEDAREAARAATTALTELLAGDAFASELLLGRHEALVRALAELEGRFDTAPPHWPALRDGGRELRDTATQALEAGRAEHADYREAMRLQVEVERRFHEVEQLLATSDADRAFANGRLFAARELLSESVTARTVDHPDWSDLRALLTDARLAVDEAESAARADFAAADAARLALHAAEEAIHDANRRYRRGVRPLLRDARDLRARAAEYLARQEYEEALAVAESGRSSALAARRAALRRVRELDAEEAAAAALAAAALHRASRRRSRSSSLFGSSGSFGSSRGHRSSSFGSSSGGSSFGRSSGGSSFGRSSGGSSFGRSAGGSTW